MQKSRLPTFFMASFVSSSSHPLHPELQSSPDDVTCADQIFDLDFFPKPFDYGSYTLAVGLITGEVDLWRCSSNGNSLVMKSFHHSASCRGVQFNLAGDILYTISSDKSIQGLDSTGQAVLNFSSAHDDPINKIVNISENLIATGDDGGVVKMWDVRVGGMAVKNWEWHDDFISGLCYHEDQNTLLSIGGDATLSAYDLRISHKRYNDLDSLANKSSRSDDQEAELSCLSVCKGGRKVLCGTQDGVILIFSWGRWGDCSDRFPGHPETVDCMLTIDDSTVLTGSSDGLIRVLSVLPNKVLGTLGDHEDFPVEAMSLSPDTRLLASIAHDDKIRFWDTTILIDEDGEEDGEGQGQGEKLACEEEGEAVGGGDGEAEDDDQWEDEGEENSDEDEEEEEGGQAERQEAEMRSLGDSDSDDEDDCEDDSDSGKEQMQKNQTSRRRLPTQSEKFFADL